MKEPAPKCCARPEFERLTADPDPLTDPGSAQAAEFTLGTCASCKKLLIHCYIGGGAAQCCEVIDRAFFERIKAAPAGKARRELLGDWFNALGEEPSAKSTRKAKLTAAQVARIRVFQRERGIESFDEAVGLYIESLEAKADTLILRPIIPDEKRKT